MGESERRTGPHATSERTATTPVAGALAGILFALLFGLSATIIISTMTELAQDGGVWLESGARAFKFAIGLVPFAGLFFLWFIAVARERLGAFEDQFFSTVFLGSGLLFIAMVFTAAATAGAVAAGYAADPVGFVGSSTYVYARNVFAQIINLYALRMGAVFMISQATLWMRTGVMPKWMAFLTYATALVLLFIVTQSLWVLLLFPGWVLVVSIYILVSTVQPRR
jgi:hypothetical protein